MGLFKTIIIYPAVIVGSATYFAFGLGRELPIASRRAGRSIGMGYNYFKTGLRFFTPDAEEANTIISQYRKGS